MKCRALSISSKHSALNFQKFPVANETAFSGISGKDNLVRYTQIFENFLAKFLSVPFAFPLRISGTFG